ncbi:hypothetical protein F5148DRAFT_558599 [Russula earlei]|uniref:Uncharacterized protein n=1 Tax=Russula earlei TaxID=71964 RepID=A0ACC0TXN7_9AGAM|nr:hypothetical protein F5148DRAFT_558599 [Russula earlei]
MMAAGRDDGVNGRSCRAVPLPEEKRTAARWWWLAQPLPWQGCPLQRQYLIFFFSSLLSLSIFFFLRNGPSSDSPTPSTTSPYSWGPAPSMTEMPNTPSLWSCERKPQTEISRGDFHVHSHTWLLHGRQNSPPSLWVGGAPALAAMQFSHVQGSGRLPLEAPRCHGWVGSALAPPSRSLAHHCGGTPYAPLPPYLPSAAFPPRTIRAFSKRSSIPTCVDHFFNFPLFTVSGSLHPAQLPHRHARATI